MWRIAKGLSFIALAGFRSRPYRSAGTPNTLNLSPLPFTLTAQEDRVCSNLATANPLCERPHLELYGVVAYVCSKKQWKGHFAAFADYKTSANAVILFRR
jgi:hypothetical protein